MTDDGNEAEVILLPVRRPEVHEARRLADRHTGGDLDSLGPLLVDELAARERAQVLAEIASVGAERAAAVGLGPPDVTPVVGLRVFYGPSADARALVDEVRRSVR